MKNKFLLLLALAFASSALADTPTAPVPPAPPSADLTALKNENDQLKARLTEVTQAAVNLNTLGERYAAERHNAALRIVELENALQKTGQELTNANQKVQQLTASYEQEKAKVDALMKAQGKDAKVTASPTPAPPAQK